ncbi:MAG: alginate lyase family protein [Kiritimatiellaeota bacterium]|nr:alginate lyase family protein [Kiritimatiellota bacterium]
MIRHLKSIILAACLALGSATAADDPTPPVTPGFDVAAVTRKLHPPPPDALKLLRREADQRLAEPLVAVTEKKVATPGGNPHDYVSLARYYWPNPKTPDGLPYLQRDGQPNPENKDYDRPRLERMVLAVEQLTLAWYLTGEARYAERAAQQLRTWFLDDATRMTPHLKHAQLIRGVNDGRGIGLIDVRGLAAVLDSETLLRGSAAWRTEDHERLVAWFRDYFTWLTTSKHGKDEDGTTNNHGIWFDVQRASIALFIGDTASARKICESARARRIAQQIEPDGRMPRELARTLSFFYTPFALDGLFRLAHIGERVGVDLWNYRTDDGRSIRAALDWLLPYATGKQPWTRKQISKPDYRPFVHLLRQAAQVYHEPAYENAIAQLPDIGDELLWVNLLHPRP